ncbi:MAG: hypothetical protein HFH13_04360 [Dorea sp.]|nr:hypothetical protein [Dorea sp.]
MLKKIYQKFKKRTEEHEELKQRLRQQIKILAECSRKSGGDELPELSEAMCVVFKTLDFPFRKQSFMMFFYFFIGIFVFIINLLRGKGC